LKNLNMERLKESISKSKDELEGHRSEGSFVIDSIESLSTIEGIIAETTDGTLGTLMHLGRELKKAEDDLTILAPSIKKTLDLLFEWAEAQFMERAHVITGQQVEMTPIEADGFILDIGGGGEGIIGKLNGRQVVAIDLSEQELKETENEALKIVMDATDIKFLPSTFDVATSFFTLLYIPRDKQEQVFTEVHRVLKDNGKFLIWDVNIPENVEGKAFFVVSLEVLLPGETVTTGYGVPLARLDLEPIKDLAGKTGFGIVDEWCSDETYYLELVKKS
jgi:SAM-dependent methyltransferase